MSGEIHRNNEYFEDEASIDLAREELFKGFELLKTFNGRIVSFFGSHKPTEDDPLYLDCRRTAALLGEQGYTVLSGGGGGIMKAANTGAMNVGAPSIGIKSSLFPDEIIADSIFTRQESFHYLFVRRFLLHIRSDVLIFFPGGYGTLDEFFDFITLIHTKVTEQIPVICYNRTYWRGLFEWLRQQPMARGYLNGEDSLAFIQFADTPEEVIEILTIS